MKFAIDRNTLRNYVRDRSKVEKLKYLGSPYKASHVRVFNVEEETALTKYLINCIKMNYGITRNIAMSFTVLLDNHESHVSIEVIRFAKENGVTLLTIPPHTSNKLQPLDVSVNSPFKSRYNAAMSNWMLSNLGKTVTIYNIPGIVKNVLSQSLSQSNILSGFRATGIHPYNTRMMTFFAQV
nr:unnamed protein product [Callosobruchus analis]